MLRNLKLFWKFALVALMIPVAAVVVAGVAYTGTQRLKSEYDNIYGFMLIPIVKIGEASQALAALSNKLDELTLFEASPAEQTQLVNEVQDNDQALMAVISQYETDWLTTLSPQFTAQLKAAGKSNLQADEAEALQAFHTAYAAYAPKRDAILAGTSEDFDGMRPELDALNAALTSLMRTNREFADISNVNAQTAVAQTRINLIIGSVLVSLIGLAGAWWLSQLVVKPVNQLQKATQLLAQGQLEVDLPPASKDEIGQMAHSFEWMVTYLQSVAATADALSRGDLTVEATPRSGQDALGHAFQRMTDNLREMVNQVAESAAKVSEASAQLAATAQQAGQATSQITTTIQQVAKGTQQQTEAVTKTATSVEQMRRTIETVARGAQEQASAMNRASAITTQIAAAIQQVSANAQTVTQNSAEAAQAARAGSLTVEQTIRSMSSIQNTVGLSAQKVQEMGQRSGQIGVIVETIDDIASQTNLLALNAAIEAARAGEHGKGFAVVADEVRKLAERASLATKEIGGLVKTIQKTVSEAVAAMDNGATEVTAGAARANEAGQALNNIIQSVETANRRADSTRGASQQMSALANDLVVATDSVSAVVEANTASSTVMAARSHEVSEAIENIASVSEQNSASVEEVSAATEEMNAQVEEVTASAQILSDMAQALQEVVNQFKLTSRVNAAPQPERKAPSSLKPSLTSANGQRHDQQPSTR